jgi:hypothetical protein
MARANRIERRVIRMRKLIVTTCLLVGGFCSLRGAVAEEPKAVSAIPNELVGTWKLVSGKYGGTESTLPKKATTLKHMTATHYMWVTYDKTGQVTRTGGGPYMFKGGVLDSTSEYGLGRDFEAIKGKAQSYKCNVKGNKWYQTGTLSTGQTLEEVWERIEKE